MRVRFAGQLVDGFVLERVDESGARRAGWPTWSKVVSPEPVLRAGGRASWPARWPTATPAPSPTCCAWPSRPATPGPRGRADAPAPTATAAGDRPADPDAGWAALPGRARRSCGALRGRAGRRGRCWTALPGEDWPARLAEAVAATVAGGRGARRGGAGRPRPRPARRRADRAARPGPARRAARRARARPSGTGAFLRGQPRRRCRWSSAPGRRRSRRSADLGLVAIWDDGDDLHAEPRAPVPARPRGAADPGPARPAPRRWSAASPAPPRRSCCVETGWAQEIVGRPRRRLRGARPGGRARPATTRSWPATRPRPRPGCPAWPGGRPGTRCAAGAPVLVQVPRRGLPAVGVLRRVPHPGPLPALRRAAGAALVARRRRPAAGAAGRPPTTPARTAAAGGCGRR